MDRRLMTPPKPPRQARNIVIGLLIGNALATPAFAATAFPIDQLNRPILVVSLVLLGIGLALKLGRAKGADRASTTSTNGFSEGIGRFRPHLGRVDE